MDEEKKIVGRWLVWIGVLLLFSMVIFGVASSIGLIGSTYVERKVFEQSYQKHEADRSAQTTYRAELQILRARLSNQDLTAGQRNEIQAQIDGITVLSSTKRD